MPELLASLHDVAPFHLERLRRAEAVLRELGATRVTYLLVPDFHRRGRADLDPGFLAWCRGPRPFAVRWALHGYTHRDEPGADAARTPVERWKARHLTGGEGEFLSRDAVALEERLERGRAVFRAVVGCEPAGFVAPAWLQTPVLAPLLRRMGFAWTEDRRAVVALAAERTVPAPVITWATRTRLRRASSIAGTPLLLRLGSRSPLLRLAVHPFDFDHPRTVASIRRVWSAAFARGSQRWYEDVAPQRVA
jgi:predicted deacetylase